MLAAGGLLEQIVGGAEAGRGAGHVSGIWSRSPIEERSCTTWVCRSISWSAIDSLLK
jgi:hypothetical protein